MFAPLLARKAGLERGGGGAGLAAWDTQAGTSLQELAANLNKFISQVGNTLHQLHGEEHPWAVQAVPEQLRFTTSASPRPNNSAGGFCMHIHLHSSPSGAGLSWVWG